MLRNKAPILYRIKCNTCNSFIIKEGLMPKLECPVDPLHSIDTSYYASLEDAGLQSTLLKDYKKHRKELIEYVTNNFQTMSVDELMYASAHFCTPKEVRDQFFSIEEQIELGMLFNSRSTESRKLRWERALVTLYNYTTLADAFLIGQDIETPVFRYLNYGLEGISEGDTEGLFDYITSTSGTSYENIGLITKNIEMAVSGVTINDVATKLLDILKGIN